jgi:hypothetical protein
MMKKHNRKVGKEEGRRKLKDVWGIRCKKMKGKATKKN